VEDEVFSRGKKVWMSDTDVLEDVKDVGIKRERKVKDKKRIN